MFDQLIYVAIAGAIVVAILALLKVMIDYPGMVIKDIFVKSMLNVDV